jgi:hypothetical protein
MTMKSGTIGFLCFTALMLPLGAGAAPADCDRACLDDIVEDYLAAMKTHDPSGIAMAPEVRYTENGVDLPLPDGLWRTVSDIGKYRLTVADPTIGEVGFFAQVLENGVPILLATRLQVVNHTISQIEAVVSRTGLSGHEGDPPNLEALGDTPRAQFRQTLAADDRRSRQEMMAIVNTYWTGIEQNTGDEPPLFADDCDRIEAGTYTTNRGVPKKGEPNSASYPCKEAFALGYYANDTRVRDRRILAVDEERGLVYTGFFIDHDAVMRSYKLNNGNTVTVSRTAPWTWMAQEIFQINKDGLISQVEAVLLSVPYGMGPGWNTGIPMPSPAAVADGFSK